MEEAFFESNGSVQTAPFFKEIHFLDDEGLCDGSSVLRVHRMGQLPEQEVPRVHSNREKAFRDKEHLGLVVGLGGRDGTRAQHGTRI